MNRPASTTLLPSPAPAEAHCGDPPATAVPRVLSFVEIKRSNPRLGDSYGHWWVEVDGTESYGWWPARCPLRLRDLLLGTTGVLNGIGGSCRGGTTSTDPHHGERADYVFHPVLRVPKSDEQVRRDIRNFARQYRGEWRWSPRPTSNCRSFQVKMLEAIGAPEDMGLLFTHGPGCPFLYPFRMAALRFDDFVQRLCGRSEGRITEGRWRQRASR